MHLNCNMNLKPCVNRRFVFISTKKVQARVGVDVLPLAVLGISEAATRGVLCKKVFLEISQN